MSAAALTSPGPPIRRPRRDKYVPNFSFSPDNELVKARLQNHGGVLEESQETGCYKKTAEVRQRPTDGWLQCGDFGLHHKYTVFAMLTDDPSQTYMGP